MKLHFVLSSVCLSLVLYGRGAVAIESRGRNDLSRYLSSMPNIRKHGYPAEEDTVETGDEYHFEKHRIPRGPVPTVRKRPPVFIQHGLGSSAHSLPYGADEFLAIESHGRNDSNRYLSSLQIIRKYGYPAEAHTVQTADGYLLEMHRIPHGLDPTVKKRPPIFIQHGLLGSSADFLMLGANQSLGFLLADLGYDVWLGNIRGNAYSTTHVSLSQDDKRFWDFSWHESAIYDLPAQIDFLRNATEQEKVVYIGHSMGTTMFFVMASVLPEYNERVELALLLAVVGYVKNIQSPLIRMADAFPFLFKVAFDILSNGAVLPERGFLTALLRWMCTYLNLAETFCLRGLFLVFGVDPAEMDEPRYNILLNHYPSGYSFKGINHYMQLFESGEFRQYDYGLIRNELKYGSPTPPDYEVEKIKVPMYFYEGQNDYLSTLPDVKRLSKRLSTLRDIRVIDYPKFNHIDFLVGAHVKKYLNDRIINDLESYLNK